MSFPYYTCVGCQRASFPKRHLCFRCGSADFEPRTLQHAIVIGYTEAHRRPDDAPYPYLVDLHAPDIDLSLVAASDFPPTPGDSVRVLLSETGTTYIER